MGSLTQDLLTSGLPGTPARTCRQEPCGLCAAPGAEGPGRFCIPSQATQAWRRGLSQTRPRDRPGQASLSTSTRERLDAEPANQNQDHAARSSGSVPGHNRDTPELRRGPPVSRGRTRVHHPLWMQKGQKSTFMIDSRQTGHRATSTTVASHVTGPQ